MTHKVVLRVRSGALPPRSYVFIGRSRCTIGRSADCDLQVPAGEVSRHHCLLEVDPPHVHVRDLVSRNGTFINGVSIGRRDPQLEPGAVPEDALPLFALHAGDQLQIGITVFTIDVVQDQTPDSSVNHRELVTT